MTAGNAAPEVAPGVETRLALAEERITAIHVRLAESDKELARQREAAVVDAKALAEQKGVTKTSFSVIAKIGGAVLGTVAAIVGAYLLGRG